MHELAEHDLAPDHFDTWQAAPHSDDKTFTAIHRHLLNYLITGRPPESDQPIQPLVPAQRLSVHLAVAETSGLSKNQARLLITLYAHGLRGHHLREVADHNNFADATHRDALIRAICRNHLEPTSAIQQIIGAGSSFRPS